MGKNHYNLWRGLLNQLKKDALILDFLQAQPPTVEAVLQLNKEDGGTRKYVVCENNWILLKQILLTTNVYRELKM